MNEYLNGELQAALEHRILNGARYRGVPALKMPTDAWVYRELIEELCPEVIVEVGNRYGGSLLYLADMSRRGAAVIGVDIRRSQLHPSVRRHPKITLVTGDAVAVFPKVAALVGGRSALVIEDSAHTYEHTFFVLDAYSALVQPGGYLICEDGVMPPVADAIAAFLNVRLEFVADRSREWPITWNPNGYLRRRA